MYRTNNPLNMGRMNNPSGVACMKNHCGYTMEIFLAIENNKIIDAKFFTDGCEATLACGSAVTELSKNKIIDTILSISPQEILDHLEGLPKVNVHCVGLAVRTLHKAIADYLY